MARFLRDEQLSNLTLTADRLIQLEQVFRSRYQLTPELVNDNDNPKAYMFYVIRFDNKGYRVFSLDELLSYFNQADMVERVIFTIETDDSLQTNRETGSYLELRLDSLTSSNCYLVVSSEDADWSDASFSGVKEVIDKCKNKHGLARGAWSELLVQLGGVFAGFLLSLWAAIEISPYIDIDNSFLITFLFVLLVFSNLWNYLNQKILSLVNALFPSVKFYRPDRDRLHWLLQAVIGGILVGITLFLLNLVFGFIGKILGQFINTGT